MDFPSNPSTGDPYTVGGVTWTWDGVKWTTSGSAGAAMPLAMNDNRIINGDMRIAQRGNNGTALGYTVDRWALSASQTGKFAWSQQSSLNFGEFPYGLLFQSSSAYAPLASDYFSIAQFIEADAISDFQWGRASAQPVTLSFWAWCSLGGTFGGAIRNGPTVTRSYPFTYALTANVWTKVIIPIPGDTAGTWALTGNNVGGGVYFDLGSGATLRAPAGAWASGNFVGANGAASVVATNGAQFYLTGVKLELGSVATPFNRQSLAKSMADCQRYYQKIGGAIVGDIILQGYVAALGGGQNLTTTIGIAAMRAAPTITAVGSFTMANVASVSFYGGLQTLAVQLLPTAAGYVSWYNGAAPTCLSANAEL